MKKETIKMGDDPAAFQGIQARHLVVIIDEACGVPDALWEAIRSLVANHDEKGNDQDG